MSKHTKGEWCPVNYAGQINIQLGEYYCDSNLLDMEMFDEEEVIANGKLMAAAPILLKELQKIQLDIKLGTIPIKKDSPIAQGIENAIAKATK
jgi:hypothetical protein